MIYGVNGGCCKVELLENVVAVYPVQHSLVILIVISIALKSFFHNYFCLLFMWIYFKCVRMFYTTCKIVTFLESYVNLNVCSMFY